MSHHNHSSIRSFSATRHPYYRPTTPFPISHSQRPAHPAAVCLGNNAEPVEEEVARLCISNLHSRVTAEDLEVLFSELGELKDYSIHYDMRGNSLGTGEVVYMRKADAIAARNRYNGVKLDGKHMIIGFVGVSSLTSFDASPVTLDSFSHYTNSNMYLGSTSWKSSGWGKRARTSTGGGPSHNEWRIRGTPQEHGQHSNRVKRKTVEELDADLDNYWVSSANDS